MEIIKFLTPLSANGISCRPNRTMIPTTITVHNTGNIAADAAQHARAQSSGNLAQSQIAVHYYVDDKSIYQCLEDDWQGWHAGDGGNTKGGNYTSIGIEICEHKGIDQRAAFDNAAWLVSKLMKDHGHISTSVIKKHKDWSGKYCPHILLDGTDGMTWDWFVSRVKAWSAVGNHWAEGAYQYLLDRGLQIHEREFDRTMTRGEVFTMLARSMGYKGK